MHSALLVFAFAAADLSPVYDQIKKRHDEAVTRLQKWIALPAIAAEGRNTEEGVQQMQTLLRDAGFQRADRIATDGKPGVFATLDAGAKRCVGLYFMYDVKQYDAAEWSSPPLDAKIVDKPGVGKVMMGRGTVNQKGPQAAFLAALHALKGANTKSPINLVLVAEGEEEIGSPHIKQLVLHKDVQAALAPCVGVFMPAAAQGIDGEVMVTLGAKGVVELELVASGEKWGRGPAKDVHSGQRARIDSPAFHLVQALATLVTKDGDPAIDGFAEKARPLSREAIALIDIAAKKGNEAEQKQSLSVTKWAHDVGYRDSLLNLAGKPTVNIEGLVGGYTGPGGKTVLPHRAVAKLDLRLVPDMTFEQAVAALKAHLKKRGFGDIEVNVTGGYDPTTTAQTSPLIQAQLATYTKAGLSASLWPRIPGSYPGFVFTGAPLSLPGGHFGIGHGSGAHAPDEYYLIDSTNPKLKGFDDAVRSFVDYLFALAEQN